MVKLEHSKYGIVLRTDDWDSIGVSTVTQLKEAIKGGRAEEALALLDYLTIFEAKATHEVFTDWTWSWLTHIQRAYGEEEVPVALRASLEPIIRPMYNLLSVMDPKSRLQAVLASMRFHRCGSDEPGDIKVEEDDEKYIAFFDPCGSGGRMRRGDSSKGIPPRTELPFNFGVVKGAYPWTWGKHDVPLYCTHCALIDEILPMEWGGYPMWVTEYSDDPQEPCRWLFYKRAEDIPEIYFTRVGKTKPA